MATADLESVFAAYRAAWRNHDLDAIVELHHPEGSFWLHTAGQTVGIGREAIRARFAGTLALLPDIVFDSLRVHWGEAFLVHEMSASGTPAVRGTRKRRVHRIHPASRAFVTVAIGQRSSDPPVGVEWTFAHVERWRQHTPQVPGRPEASA